MPLCVVIFNMHKKFLRSTDWNCMTDFHEKNWCFQIWLFNSWIKKINSFKHHSLVNGKTATFAFKTIKLIVYVLKLNIFN